MAKMGLRLGWEGGKQRQVLFLNEANNYIHSKYKNMQEGQCCKN